MASDVTAQTISDAGYDYRTVVAYCQATQYQAINNAKQAAVYANQQQVMANKKYEINLVIPKQELLLQEIRLIMSKYLGWNIIRWDY